MVLKTSKGADSEDYKKAEAAYLGRVNKLKGGAKVLVFKKHYKRPQVGDTYPVADREEKPEQKQEFNRFMEVIDGKFVKPLKKAAS